MPTSLDYAKTKFQTGALGLAIRSDDQTLRDRLVDLFTSAVMHAHPPFERWPHALAARTEELFRLVSRGPVFDPSATHVAQTIELMSQDELEQVASEIIEIYAALVSAVGSRP